jgi:hypothetical protein
VPEFISISLLTVELVGILESRQFVAWIVFASVMNGIYQIWYSLHKYGYFASKLSVLTHKTDPICLLTLYIHSIFLAFIQIFPGPMEPKWSQYSRLPACLPVSLSLCMWIYTIRYNLLINLHVKKEEEGVWAVDTHMSEFMYSNIWKLYWFVVMSINTLLTFRNRASYI